MDEEELAEEITREQSTLARISNRVMLTMENLGNLCSMLYRADGAIFDNDPDKFWVCMAQARKMADNAAIATESIKSTIDILNVMRKKETKEE